MKQRFAFLIIMTLAGAITLAGNPVSAAQVYNEDYAGVLAHFVKADGFVDYAGLAKDRAGLDSYVDWLAAADNDFYKMWGKNDQIAFWINAYNGLTLRLIVDHYPIEASTAKAVVWPRNSIRQIDGAWTKYKFDVMGDLVTLDEIEHKVLRRQFNEPRIHMALVCAAVSCPPLRAEPYRGSELDVQLEDQTRKFLASPEKFSIDRDAGVVKISAIFDWFAGDFVEKYGEGPHGDFDEKQWAVLRFIAQHVDNDARAYLGKGDYTLEYFDYDWTLNESTH